MISLMIRIWQQIRKDHRSLAMILFAPLLLLGLLYLLLGEPTYMPRLAVAGLPAPLVAALQDQPVLLTELAGRPDNDEIRRILTDGEADAVALAGGTGLEIRMYEADGYKSAEIMKVLRAAMTTLAPQASLILTTLYGDPDAPVFDGMGYIFLGILSFFFVYLIAGISFVRERTTGTLERLMMTPIHRWQVVGGYFLGFGLFAALQSVLVILFSHYVLGMTYLGPLPAAMLIMILLSLTAVSMGMVVSIFAGNEFQVVQTIPVIIVPQVFFTGLIPVDTLPFGLSHLAVLMPVFYGCRGLQAILVHGQGLDRIGRDLIALLVFIGVLFLTNILALKKYRRT